ncbi:hypothetical protein [Paenibacillus sp. PL91]|uniref:hypothetical protein n=1 Tax=Paenibacillus sp. PL91 TaxID=2729538 RepID=UPI00145E1596|nr:hypothetical protein [Paenibacillus sp. PL91]MBC9204099.1 hypothetical protein [Paenibacillus sp. PL91]
MAVGLKTIAEQSKSVSDAGADDQMYKGIRFMAEANYLKMMEVVISDALILKAFEGHEELHKQLQDLLNI